ncbi:hypothetical protein KC19_VG019700 [Ceratodon purpureus]|uniref:Uncharacterized protein n=1 Tax=Ceratodon purpureus TaxID=3225 RepID=A0A8T0HL74_CERPU|nr:hypothetical protein KC19_VG019700 [Ceratodon purpureus]
MYPTRNPQSHKSYSTQNPQPTSNPQPHKRYKRNPQETRTSHKQLASCNNLHPPSLTNPNPPGLPRRRLQYLAARYDVLAEPQLPNPARLLHIRLGRWRHPPHRIPLLHHRPEHSPTTNPLPSSLAQRLLQIRHPPP